MRRSDVAFPTVEQVSRAHARAIRDAGGSSGIRDPGLLESAVLAAQHGYHETLAEVAAVLAYGIAKNHAFVDGNKRTALLVAVAFLDANGLTLVLEELKWEAIFVGVAAGSVSRDELERQFAEAMGGDPVPLDD